MGFASDLICIVDADPDLAVEGARADTVTTAMGDLARAGAVSKADDGAWMLHGSPPAELRHHRLVAAMT